MVRLLLVALAGVSYAQELSNVGSVSLDSTPKTFITSMAMNDDGTMLFACGDSVNAVKGKAVRQHGSSKRSKLWRRGPPGAC